MRGVDRKSVFALFAVVLMMSMPLSMMDQNLDADGITDVLPIGETYGVRITIEEVVSGGNTANGIKSVEFGDKNKTMTEVYSDFNYNTNILYDNEGNVITSSTNPNYNDILRFNEATGLGPFNSYYVAINLKDNADNGDLYKTSTGKGQIAYILNPYNLSQAIITNGNSPYSGSKDNYSYYEYSQTSDYNILLFIPTVYWHSDADHLWLSNNKDYFNEVSPELMVARAHTIEGQIRPYLGLGVYEASELNGALVSQTEKTPATNKNIAQFRLMVDKLNDTCYNGEYMLWNYYQWTLYKMMSYSVIGAKNSQAIIGEGVSRTNNVVSTGSGDLNGPYWGGQDGSGTGYKTGKNPVKLFLENTWGSAHDLLDDVWIGDGQLHAGQNSIDTLNAHVLNPTEKGTDSGLNDNQPIINNAVLPNTWYSWLSPILYTSTSPDSWDFPLKISSQKNSLNGGSVQYSPGYQTVSVGGHYDSRDHGGLNRMNVRNDFGTGYKDIGTRIAYLTYGGTLSYAESSDYKVTSEYGDLPNGYSVFKSVEIQVVPKDAGKTITSILVNGVPQAGNSFIMPGEDVQLTVIVGDTVPVPGIISGTDCIASYTYDGQTHVGLYDSGYYTITGTNSAKDAGEYTIQVQPGPGYEWDTGGQQAKTFTWTIEKKLLQIEGSSSADIKKTYDGTTALANDEAGRIDASDLFIYGLATGEVPNIAYNAKYTNASVGTGKQIKVTSLSLSDSDSFNINNYIYNFKAFNIYSQKIAIVGIDLSTSSVEVSDIPGQEYTGYEITPLPTVIIDEEELVLDVDYTLSYTDNKNVGTATVTIEGKGNYTNSVTKTFTIAKKVVAWPDIVKKDYTGSALKADLQDTEWYSVVTDAKGTSIGTYTATLRLSDPANTKWIDSEETDRTDTALEIRDVVNGVSFLLGGSYWVNGYSAPATYKSSEELALPSADKVAVYSKKGYNVEFIGWYASDDAKKTIVTSIPAGSTGDKYYTALYSETLKSFTVRFVSTENAIPDQIVKYQGKVEKPATPVTEHFVFAGWYQTYDPEEKIFSNLWDFDNNTVSGDLTLYAKWDPKTYTVTWKNWDGTELEKDSNVEYKANPEYNGSVPKRPSDGYNSYTFSGWDPELSIVENDIVYTAQYTPTTLYYNVSVTQNDSFIVTPKEGSVNPMVYGSNYSFFVTPNPGLPQFSQLNQLTVKVGNETLTRGGDGSYTVTNVTKNINVDISITINVYQIRWLDISGQPIYDVTPLPHNTGISAPGTPTGPHTQDPSLEYTFIKWTKNSTSGDPVSFESEFATADTTYYAHFSSQVKTFKILYSGNQQFTIEPLYGGNLNSVEYGDDITFRLVVKPEAMAQYSQIPSRTTITATSATVVKDNETNEFTVKNVTADQTLSFQGITLNGYTVKWLDENENVISTAYEVKHGQKAIAPANPAKADSESETFTFSKWLFRETSLPVDLNTYVVTSDVEFIASYTSHVKEYQVTLQQNALYVLLDSNDGTSAVVTHGTLYTFTLTYEKGTKEYVLSVNDTNESERPMNMTVSTDETDPTKVVITYTINVTDDAAIKVVASDVDLWNVSWMNGSVLVKTERYMDNSTPISPAAPTKSPTAQFSYTFAGWSDGEAVVDLNEQRITADTTYYAVYDEAINYYPITLPSGGECNLEVCDGSTSPTAYGGSFSFKISPSSNPRFTQLRDLAVYANGEEITLEDGRYTVSNISGPVEISIHLTINKYTVIWVDESDNELFDSILLPYGAHVPNPGIPSGPVTKDDSLDYSFDHWTRNSIDGATIGDITADAVPIGDSGYVKYYAHFSTAVKTFKIVYQSNDLFTLVTENGKDRNSIPYGEEYQFSVAVNPEKMAAYSQIPDRIVVTANGAKIDPVDGTYTISNITEDKNLGFSGITINGYTVTWLNADGSVKEKTLEVKHGSTPNAPDMSSLNNAQYTYSVSWTKGGADVDLSLEKVISDVSYKAVLTPTLNKYTVIWKNWDGSVLQTDFDQDYGTMPTFNNEDPTRPSDSMYSYTFSGWTPEVGTVEGNATYMAKFDSHLNKAYVTWINPDGEVLKTGLWEIGSLPSYTGTPEMAPDVQYTYTFKEWSPKVTTVTENTIYTAVYDRTVNEYTITWVNHDGKFISSQKEKYGNIPEFKGDTPTRAADAHFTYTFEGWGPAVDKVTGDAVYFAKFTETANKYAITWKNWDDKVILTETVEYGKTPVYSGVTPTRSDSTGYKYTWVGWTPSITSVTGDATYTAVFDKTDFDVTITIMASTEELHHFGVVTHEGTYTVKSTAVVSMTPINVERAATTGISSTLTISGLDIEFDAMPQQDPGMDGLLIGWYIDMDAIDGEFLIAGKDGLVIQAKFIQVPTNYSVLISTTFGSEGQAKFSLPGETPTEVVALTADNTPLGTVITVNEDSSLDIGGKVVEVYPQSTESKTIVFHHWEYILTGERVKTGDRVDVMTVIGAAVTSTLHQSTITWKDWDGSVLRQDIVPNGTMPTYGSDPIRAGEGERIYTFTGWSPEIVSASGDATYTATYSSNMDDPEEDDPEEDDPEEGSTQRVVVEVTVAITAIASAAAILVLAVRRS